MSCLFFFMGSSGVGIIKLLRVSVKGLSATGISYVFGCGALIIMVSFGSAFILGISSQDASVCLALVSTWGFGRLAFSLALYGWNKALGLGGDNTTDVVPRCTIVRTNQISTLHELIQVLSTAVALSYVLANVGYRLRLDSSKIIYIDLCHPRTILHRIVSEL